MAEERHLETGIASVGETGRLYPDPRLVLLAIPQRRAAALVPRDMHRFVVQERLERPCFQVRPIPD
ncbi:hypothetical protein KTH_33530 [Thermosporothrix hazakensis]|uniref:Uncharacterized protein n=1 Tax=Thermosporothrix sp. COM3 TaxID=2490863 RepID=A0A455SPY8_9CHLR|nr:hypothetical protein KTC_51980 [Thermosporothrix sp. COM3]GCE48484.1 hypothetical protein KTH_33530 [Thermosporothrix hazakensis]